MRKKIHVETFSCHCYLPSSERWFAYLSAASLIKYRHITKSNVITVLSSQVFVYDLNADTEERLVC